MSAKIYTFSFNPDWMQLANEISRVDRFDASWTTIEKKASQTLKQLKSIATVRSVGASTRIEGSKMIDEEVEILIKDLAISKLEDRDQQEVAGYYEAVELITESYRDIEITESNLKHLHGTRMRYCIKDEWHKGDYKQHSNVVEAQNPDGSKTVVFRTSDPGFATQDAIRNLIAWYESDNQTHALIKVAIFVYDFLGIHPFQDGNGRLSRLLSTLLLLRKGYSWVQFVSFEHEIENRKSEYYKTLIQCQKQRPGEDVYPWVMFFLDCLKNIQIQLNAKLEVQTPLAKFSQREKNIYAFIENHSGSQSGDISKKLGIPLPTVKKTLSNMVSNKLLSMNGKGSGINYTIGENIASSKDQAVLLTNGEQKVVFDLVNLHSFIEIKKIILTPHFKWSHPDEWGKKLNQNGLYIDIACYDINGNGYSQRHSVLAYNSPYHYQPVFLLKHPIVIPSGSMDIRDYLLKVSITLMGTSSHFDFDVMLVYDIA